MKKGISLAIVLIMIFGSIIDISAQRAPDPNKWYRLENGQNKKSMANNGQQNSGAVMIAKSQVQNGGHWKFVPMGNGTYRIQNFYSKMYLANFQQKNSGAQLKQTDKPGPGALWRLKKASGRVYTNCQ
jgi:hypothetical protein